MIRTRNTVQAAMSWRVVATDPAHQLRRIANCVLAVAAASVIATALAPDAVADHDTVGGGRFEVSNSDDPCTDFRADATQYTVCNGGWINLPPGAEYISVPLGSHDSVGCKTFATDGSLFDHDDENLADVSDKQQFWAARGWGPYVPQALCQLW